MYLDDMLLASIDERWALPGKQPDSRCFGQLAPDTLAFRLDPYSGVPSEVTISNLRFGYSVRAPEFLTNFTDGPDRNEDELPDAVVEVRSRENYTFRLDFYQPDLPAALVRDVVPSDWEVVSGVPENPLDLVLVAPTGQPQHKGYRATEIQWFPTDNDGSLNCTLRLRRHSNQQYEPHQCGALFLNVGAAALDSSTRQPLLDENGLPLRGRRIFVAAVNDHNHDGTIDWSGAGDEDGDGLLDHDEYELGRDPRHPEPHRNGVHHPPAPVP